MPFPARLGCTLNNGHRIHFHPDDLNNFQANGTYFQNRDADIHIGRGTYIAPNVGIITANHDLQDLDKHLPGQDVVIGRNCWIGMNAVILPGVVLGDRTIVGAGSVVTRSFAQGNCVLAGNPARLLRNLGGDDPN
jgi:acetyltransferase-like isoleucine patch superfamily enzyme